MRKYVIGAVVIGLVLMVGAALGSPIFVKFPGSDTVYKAYQTAEQFFADGGAKDFSNVQVVDEMSFGSVNLSNEYHSTTTNAASPAYFLLKSGTGALGSVIITGSQNNALYLYDASTTDSAKRTKTATSSLNLLAAFPPQMATSTYTFDTTFFHGLLVYFASTIAGTTTFTYR